MSLIHSYQHVIQACANEKRMGARTSGKVVPGSTGRSSGFTFPTRGSREMQHPHKHVLLYTATSMSYKHARMKKEWEFAQVAKLSLGLLGQKGAAAAAAATDRGAMDSRSRPVGQEGCSTRTNTSFGPTSNPFETPFTSTSNPALLCHAFALLTHGSGGAAVTKATETAVSRPVSSWRFLLSLLRR